MTDNKMGMTGVGALFLCAAAALSGCNRDSDPAPAATPAVKQLKQRPPAAVKPGATAEQQTVGMVQASSQGKSQVPVELKFELAQRPKVGQRLEINLALIAQISASPATIQVSGADDVSVAPGANQFDIAAEEAGEVYRHSVSVTPNAEGVVLVGVTVLLKHDDVVDQRVFSIPIIVER